MTSRLVRAAASRSLATVRHVSVVPPAAAAGLVGVVYAQAVRDFGMVAPPLAAHSPSPRPLAASWVLLRETLLATGRASRAAKEAVASAVSRTNACPYCVEVHGATLAALAGAAPHTDPELAAVTAWAGRAGVPAAGQPPPASQVSELAGVALSFHYLNRMAHVFLGDSPLPAEIPRPLRRTGLRWLGRRLAAGAPYPRPGAALSLLPPATLPPDLSWAADRPPVAEALARTSAAFEATGRRAVAGPVRDLVRAELEAWTGDRPGISRSWVEPSVAELADVHRPAARLALLVALSSYQVDDGVIADFRRRCPDDAALVDLTSWASFAAARRAASWLVPGAVVAGL
ncbi:carboxymuconolactone decarboxylase family protein [Actinomycetes bacterium KLBMP 9797]